MTSSDSIRPAKLAVMGGAYGNLAALSRCIEDANQVGAEIKAFMGDSIGCCGHSNEVVAMIRGAFGVFVAGNHEQQAVARRDASMRGAELAVKLAIVGGIGALVLALGFTALTVRSITVPLKQVERSIASITNGDLDAPMPPTGISRP